MFKLFSNKRLFALLLGLIFFIALMGFSFGSRETITWPEKFVKDSVSWMQALLYRPAQAIAGFFGNIHDLTVTYEENRILKRTLAQYARDTVRLNELEAQNERLKQALGFTESQKQSNNYIWHIAEVVGASPDPLNNVIVINLGEKNGIWENMAVMTVEGLIGRVDKVFPFHANVQLLTDINEKNNESKGIAVTVKGKESDSFGIIENFDRATGFLQMSRIRQNDLLEVGDVVITSGLGQVFPKGIVIGTVVSRKEGEFGLSHTAQVKPAASFLHLREVFVVEMPKLR